MSAPGSPHRRGGCKNPAEGGKSTAAQAFHRARRTRYRREWLNAARLAMVLLVGAFLAAHMGLLHRRQRQVGAVAVATWTGHACGSARQGLRGRLVSGY